MKPSLSLAVAALAGTLLLAAPAANAITLPASSGLADASQTLDPVEQARTVCRRHWNGYRWRTRCYWVRDWRPYRSWRYRHWRRW